MERVLSKLEEIANKKLEVIEDDLDSLADYEDDDFEEESEFEEE